MKKLPEFLRKYFWDVDFEKMDHEKYPGFVILRIMEYGDKKSVEWMMKNFPRVQIIEFFKKTRDITLKSAVFWALILKLRRENVKCLSRSFRETQKQFWPY